MMRDTDLVLPALHKLRDTIDTCIEACPEDMLAQYLGRDHWAESTYRAAITSTQAQLSATLVELRRHAWRKEEKASR